MASNDVKKVTVSFEGGVFKARFEGDWTGRDLYVAMRSLEKGYRLYQAERRKASQGSMAVETGKGTSQWSGSSDSTSSGSQTTVTQAVSEVKSTTLSRTPAASSLSRAPSSSKSSKTS